MTSLQHTFVSLIKRDWAFLATTCLLIAIFGTVFSYLIAYAWLEDGFSTIETSLLAIIPGCMFFLSSLVISIISSIRYTRYNLKENTLIMSWWLQWLLISLGISIVALVIDYLFFILIDNSIPVQFGEALRVVMEANGQDVTTIDGFIKIPFFIQNIFSIIFMVVLSNLIALLIGRAIGKNVAKPQLEY